jgi:hypothetical protein
MPLENLFSTCVLVDSVLGRMCDLGTDAYNPRYFHGKSPNNTSKN